MNARAWLVVVATLPLVVGSTVIAGCDDAVPASSCLNDSDCSGGRICFSGLCAFPASVDAQTDSADDATVDTQPPPDATDDTTEPVDGTGPDTRPGDVGPTDTHPGGICDEALAHIEACPELDFRGQYGLAWPGCTPRDACAARCALNANCDGLRCDFDGNIDCDGIGVVEECMWNRCDDMGSECEADGACGATYDCCGEQWLCHPLDDPPPTCDLECEPPIMAPTCGCLDGRCTRLDAPDTVCAQALDHFMNTCGYTIAGLPTWMEDDITSLIRMVGGDCDPQLQCYSRCMLADENDQCMQCHFGGVPCTWDPFGACTEACNDAPGEAQLCELTGGKWGATSCESCCGPPACGDDPFAPCPLACCGPPQCYCPPEQPFWNVQLGCYEAPECYP